MKYLRARVFVVIVRPGLAQKMVRENLTPKMRYAAFFHGKRLIGVDLLVVGSDHRVGGGSPSRKKSIMIHTVDPSEN